VDQKHQLLPLKLDSVLQQKEKNEKQHFSSI
jgi:hypothetical protein